VESSGKSRSWGSGALVAAVLLLALCVRVASVFQANVHWDEFGLLHFADRTATTGVLTAGGRPGLAVAMLLPFVEHCDDEVSVIRRARLLWVAFTVLWLLGTACWIAELLPDRATRWRDAALGTALVALVPAVVESSLQVRTDQVALAGGAWGGALLLGSRRIPALALAAGLCLGIAFLGSQKALYLATLAALLAAGQGVLLRELRPSREALRAVLAAGGAAAALVGFRLWADAAFEVPVRSTVAKPLASEFVRHSFSTFDFYRNTIGWDQYRALLPGLAAHGVLLVGLVAASVAAVRRREWAGPLTLAWAVLALGAAVALFHAAAFSYFWMTLGMFPAIALALARGRAEAVVPQRLRGLAEAGVWTLLLVPGALQMTAMLHDAQDVQRESLGFVHRNFPREAAGFHPESALFCQEEPKPFQTYYSQHIYRDFTGPNRELLQNRLVGRFRNRPVAFIVQSFRLNQFPAEVRRFWAENYQPYRASVFVAGRRLEGARGEAREIELIVPGRYRWIPFTGPQPLAVAEQVVPPGGIVELESGHHPVRFVEDVPGGMLVLALAEPPGEAPLPFYQ
jgi:hypothetical protein